MPAVSSQRYSTPDRVSKSLHQMPRYSDEEEDDHVSDDPAWYHAPRGSVQAAFPLSVLQKRESQRSNSSSTASNSDSDPVSPHSDRNDDEEDENNDYFPPVHEPVAARSSLAAPRRSCLKSSAPKVAVRVQIRAKGSTSKLGEVKRLSLERLSGSDLSGKSDESEDTSPVKPRVHYQSSSHRSSMDMRDSMDMGGRDSMMKYRPSDLTLHDLKSNLMTRDSLAALADEHNPLLSSSRGSMAHMPRQSDAELPELLRAAKTGNMMLLKACLQDRATDVTQRDAVHGQTALHIAVRHGQFAAVRMLCQKKHCALLVDSVDARANTPLHLASARSRRVTKFLLEHARADVTKVNARGQTALGVHILTTRRDDPLVTEMLLQHKADAQAQLDSSTILHKAVELKLFEIASRLVRYGARLDIKDENGKMVFDKVNRKVLRQLINKISFPPVWVPNEERPNCMLCSRKFSKLRIGVRRHHCRHCGRLCCGQCSHVSVESVAFPKAFDNRLKKGSGARNEHMKRVCKTCSSVFNDRQKPQEEKTRMSEFMTKTFGCEWEELTGQQNGPRSSLAH